MEEEVGFEPTEPLRVQRFSRPARSTTPALFLLVRWLLYQPLPIHHSMLSATTDIYANLPVSFLYIKLKILNCKVIFIKKYYVKKCKSVKSFCVKGFAGFASLKYTKQQIMLTKKFLIEF